MFSLPNDKISWPKCGRVTKFYPGMKVKPNWGALNWEGSLKLLELAQAGDITKWVGGWKFSCCFKQRKAQGWQALVKATAVPVGTI